MNERDTLKVNERGHLEIGGADTVELAEKFGTPLYVLDEQYIRNMCAVYRDTLKNEYGDGLVLYASKALSCIAMYNIVDDEKIGADVVSGGELYTAMRAGFPAEKIYMHGNNKLPEELKLALDAKVGTIVCDSFTEMDLLDELCAARKTKQKVILRINPGVEAHTHKAVQTAKTDSKFGFSIQDRGAFEAVDYARGKKNLKLAGFHCHIGSQIFEKKSFALAAEKMTDFVAALKAEKDFVTDELNFGGGFGIWYTDEDAKISCGEYAEYLRALIETVKAAVETKGIKKPFLVIEPGRSIVGEAGITLYTVGAIKDIPGVKKYVAVDGGMFDNPRYALYQSKYSALLANRAAEPAEEIVTVAGKCCESGDMVCANVNMPKAKIGDIVAVLSTGAYNYSMASNYNRNPVPPVVLVNKGKARYIVKPQSYDDLVRNDVPYNN